MLNQQSIFTRDVHTETGLPLQLTYYRLVQQTPDGVRYGAAVRCLAPDGETYAEARDITSVPARINQLLALLSGGAVTPVGFGDIVADFL